MRKLLIIASLLLLITSPAMAVTDMMGQFTYGTLSQNITLGDAYWVAIHPRTAEVIALSYTSISGVSTSRDYVYIQAGQTMVLNVSGMSHVTIVRATATVVDYAISTFRDVTPQISSTHGMATLMTNTDSLIVIADSLVTLLSQPGPIEVWSDNTILTADIKRSNVILSGPQTGLYVEGAVGMMVVCTYDTLNGRSNNKVTIKQWFVSAAGDTTSKCVDTLGDTITLDAAIYGAANGSLTWFPKMKNGQGCFTGYYYITVDSWGVVTLRNFQVSARMVYW